MGFFDQIEAPTKAVIKAILSDPDLKVTITYKKYKGQGDFSGGSAKAEYTDYSLDVVRLRHTVASQLVGTSGIQVGDQLYMADGDTVPAGMSKKDRLLDELGIIQQIKSIDNIFGLAVAFTVETG